MHRKRTLGIMATYCGKPAVGNDRETKFCQVGVSCQPTVDCEFTHWSEWSVCSTTCNGVKRRSRSVGTYGRGAGRFCEGALQQTWPCNDRRTQECGGERPQACELSDWDDWNDCTATCGGGQQSRSRNITKEPLNGGIGCYAPLKELQECGRLECVGNLPVDCELGDWEDWAMCDRCGGNRKRSRRIMQHAKNGGQNCDLFASEENGPCPVECDVKDEGFCTWSAWSSWGACSSRCGAGRRSRGSDLILTEEPTELPAAWLDSELMVKFDDLEKRKLNLQARGLQFIAASFALGCLSFGLVQGVVRLGGAAADWKRRRGLRRPSRQAYQHLQVDDDVDE